MVHRTKGRGPARGPRGRHRSLLAGVVVGAIAACSIGGWCVVADWGGGAVAAQIQSSGRGRQPQPQLSESEARAGLDARLERLSVRQARGEASEMAPAALRWAMREQSPPSRVPPTPPQDLLEEASRAMEGQP